MYKSKYLERILENGMYYNSILSQYLIYDYENLKISNLLKERIKTNIDSNQNFEIPLSKFSTIQMALDLRIEELLKHPDFDPFKEEKRKRFPQQYGSDPFQYKGVTYYLYSKLNPIDSLIKRIIGFKKLIEDHIAANKPLRYVYKE
ncbi:hypothetical protein [Chryseobacterium arthrosphaerae]|uniref:hypothetical protein n=1 Tax=Chryseobacterium arthrosphaerae TaxID=651561 RepID=UPI001E5CC05C|nr:hypothetical protein [Chryseobacterium arthrosphaerae]UEQ75363.1 hypothetical protein J8N07_17105 [Chryseobacterium arthrosphaerae]